MKRPIAPVIAAVTVAAVCLTFAQDSRTSAPPNKIAAALRSAANVGGRLQVFILLKDQPHRQIVAEVEQFYHADRESAHLSYQQESGTGTGGRARLLEARRHLDEILLRSRREAIERIGFRLRPQRDAMTAHLSSLGASRIRAYQTVNLFRAEIPASALPMLESHPDLAAVFPIGVETGQLNVSVPATGAPKFWGYGWTGAGERVGVIDTGVTPHVALPAGGLINAPFPFLGSGAFQPGFIDATSGSNDLVGHGTEVAGVIMSADKTCPTPGCLGMTKGTGSVLNLKAGYKLASGGGFSDSFQQDDAIDAFDWAFVNHPEVKVFNFSAGRPAAAGADADNFSDLLDYLADVYGVTIVASAGNDNNSTAPANQLSSPGIGYNLITVANADATGAQPVIAPTSSLGPVAASHRSKPDIAAPGTRIATTSLDGKSLVQSSGTSIAAPHIAGAAALIRSAGVTDSLAIKALLLNSANGAAGWQRDMGWGFVNLSTLADLLNVAKQTGREAYVSASLQMSNANSFKLFHLKPFLPRKATLVWNRHFNPSLQPVFNQLNLFAYRLQSNQNSIADTAAAPIVDNVKQTPNLPGDDLVLKVKSTNAAQPAGTLEPFALAVSNGALSPLNGPAPGLSCVVQTSQTQVAAVPVNCTATISGDAPIANVTAVSDDGQSIAFGNMDPSSLTTQTITRTIHATTPSSSTPVTHTVTMTGQAFGETFTVVSTFTVFQSDGDGTGGIGGGQGSCPQTALFGVNPTNITLGIGANSGSFGVQAAAGCKWTADTYAGPVQVISGFSGAGPGTVSFQAFPGGFGNGNPFAAVIVVTFDLGPWAPPQARERAVMIQLPPVTCSFTAPSTVSVGASSPSGTVTGTIPVTASASSANCGWGAFSTTSWITFNTASGTGSGAAILVAQNNPSSKPRTGTVMVANQAVAVTQPGVPCSYVLSPAASGVLSASTSLGGTFTVTAPNDCPWTPKPSMPWIEILNVKYTGINGGNGMVTYGVAENFSMTVAHGTIAVGSATYNITQPATTPCAAAYAPSNINVDAGENKGQLDVKVPDGCVWRLPATPAWIHLSLKTPSATPSGSQVVLYTVDANTSTPTVPAMDRSATAGATTFHQAPFTVTARKVQMGARGGKSDIVIEGPANLPLDVRLINGVNWITVQRPQTSGGGHATRYTLAITVDPNLTPGTRSTPVFVTLTGGTPQAPRTAIPVTLTQDGTP